MANSNHYQTLEVSPTASPSEIKQAYRRLAKQYHPDSHQASASHDRIAAINVAYEILSDPTQRQSYDRELNGWRYAAKASADRAQRTATAQREYQQRHTGREADEQLQHWLQWVFQPVSRLVCGILNPLRDQIDALAADPFDDELMEDFQAYIDDCRDDWQKAQQIFRSRPNPPIVASVAAHLYYCLNQVGDGLDELERFTVSYDEHYLHTGQELFRIASGLRKEAQAAIRDIPY